jgi:hypothetical protein
MYRLLEVPLEGPVKLGILQKAYEDVIVICLRDPGRNLPDEKV